ncbi:acyl-CoA dehydrogenase family protein [Phytohabitans suffuscus]|uniref:glutaryl-CoA dehydrogenase (ETF) n=1 Tax=Phytohabitans suffuscus TaxID=624315 RepID=A0A6F8YV95_9ACTN|nr:acyl-CoA dehydrogenase family protein [Phytohabitans suffuscus]BCB89913.1 glutaryl-CoA dehydrogenase [Phytohabitans suffuscus]
MTTALADLTDTLDLADLLSEEERMVQQTVRDFVHKEVSPYLPDWYADGHLPADLAPRLGALGLLGMHLEGYGCAGMSATAYGLACLELEAADSGLRSMVSVQGSLAMVAIHRYGSPEQRQHYLPGMAAGETIGCFGLTEPDAGSDPGSMTTRAERRGGDWVLDGRKMWITNGGVAGVAVVWARTGDGVAGFLVPRGTPGFSTADIPRKQSMRASTTSELILDGCRLPDTARLPLARGLSAPLSCLNEARYGILWGAMGAARTCFTAALDYARTRQQFGRPIGGFQLTQDKLVRMHVELEKGLLLAHHLGRVKDARGLRPEQVSFGKLNNTRAALAIAREARTILGASGITLDYPVMRHMANLESVLTYEGTPEIHTLVLGHRLTGVPAYR